MEETIVDHILDELLRVDGNITLRKFSDTCGIDEPSCRLVLESARRCGLLTMQWYTDATARGVGFSLRGRDENYSKVSDEEFLRTLAGVTKLDRGIGFLWTQILEGSKTVLPSVTAIDIEEAQRLISKFTEPVVKQIDEEVAPVKRTRKSRKSDSESYYEKFCRVAKLFSNTPVDTQLSVISVATKLRMTVHDADLLTSAMYHFGMIASERHATHSPNRLYWRTGHGPVMVIPVNTLFVPVFEEIRHHRSSDKAHRLARLGDIVAALKIVMKTKIAMEIWEYADFISASIEEAALHVHLMVEFRIVRPNKVVFDIPENTSFTVNQHKNFYDSMLTDMIVRAKSLPKFGPETLQSFVDSAVFIQKGSEQTPNENSTSADRTTTGRSSRNLNRRTYRLNFFEWLKMVREQHGNHWITTTDAKNTHSLSHQTTFFCCVVAAAFGYMEIRPYRWLTECYSGRHGYIHWRLTDGKVEEDDKVEDMARGYISDLREMGSGFRIDQLQELLVDNHKSKYQDILREMLESRTTEATTTKQEAKKEAKEESGDVDVVKTSVTAPSLPGKLPGNRVYIVGALGVKTSPKVVSDIIAIVVKRYGKEALVLSVDTSGVSARGADDIEKLRGELVDLIGSISDSATFVVHGATLHVHLVIEILSRMSCGVLLCESSTRKTSLTVLR